MLIKIITITNMIYYLGWGNNHGLVVLVGLPLAEGRVQSLQGLLKALHDLKE